MNKLVIAAVALASSFACTPAELQKVNDTVDKVQAQVNCRADALQPYVAYFTKDSLAAAIQTAKAPTEALEAVSVVKEEIEAVVAAYKKCAE
jgi:outer membrane murein-binding lipoprotein Lpp